MPTDIFHNNGEKYIFDARPDRIDLRDRIYRPPLVSLPDQYPRPDVIEDIFQHYGELVLDQKRSGACTGFGLAAVIHYLLFQKAHTSGISWEDAAGTIERVSPAMLYQTAQLYDEWEEEDFTGSSCRGAMKGWHKHGVCREATWPYDPRKRTEPIDDSWRQEAARVPIGAYYRVDSFSVTDLQAAVYEVGAVFASCRIHRGWLLRQEKWKSIPTIKRRKQVISTHAFAIVGYNSVGFYVQNSNGPEWGFKGFALLPYDDWIAHAVDAWVAVLGAPMQVTDPGLVPSTTSKISLEESVNSSVATGSEKESKPQVASWSREYAYRHCIVQGQGGFPINRLVSKESATSAVKQVSYDSVREWCLEDATNRKLALYIHGGLVSEKNALLRARRLGPYFEENGIYPLFQIWKTGPVETALSLFRSVVSDILPGPAEGISDWLTSAKNIFKEKRDRLLEVTSRTVALRAAWKEMKSNCEASMQKGGATNQVSDWFKTLRDEFPDLEIHLIGHSAGAIVIGHILSLFTRQKIQIASCHLYAPACTTEFANSRYGNAISSENRTLRLEDLYFHILSDGLEREDNAGPYGKSLLYLISRALEDTHKTPILGMEFNWDYPKMNDQYADVFAGAVSKKKEFQIPAQVKAWSKIAGKLRNLQTNSFSHFNVYRNPQASETRITRGKLKKTTMIETNHGSFDNNIETLTQTLSIIKGSSLTAPVTDLSDPKEK